MPGSWTSPLTPELLVEKSNTPSGLLFAGSKLNIIENRPGNGGKNSLCTLENGVVKDVLPGDHNIRTRVHEYGGSCIAATSNGTIFFTEFADQRIYRSEGNASPVPLTPVGPYRFACLTVDEKRQLLYAVQEDHSHSDLQPLNRLVKICLQSGEIFALTQGCDFYSSPALSPDGRQLAYICWNHPQMPWDGTELHIAELDEAGDPVKDTLVCGGSNESVLQPEWAGEKLVFVSDRSGFWNLYCRENGRISPLLPQPRDFARPMWSIGASSYAVMDTDRLFVTWCENASWYAGILALDSKEFLKLDLPFNSYSSLCVGNNQVYFIATSFAAPTAVVGFSPDELSWKELYRPAESPLSEEFISIPTSIEFLSEGQNVQAFYYPPRHPENALRPEEKPPLLVISHGGPTGAATLSLQPATQFWTSRGFAVVDVNYSGSSGFGRAYRDRLKKNWGIIDRMDCEAAARHLIDASLADPERIAIRGGSAGGFTTLCALTFGDLFKAGASHFGLSDLEILARETHKFESRYMDSLIGPYPEFAEVYRQRSPINNADRLSCPVIFLQGLDDKVVPPNQAQRMFEVLREKGIATAYVAYSGEGHGFRRAENIKHSLEAELYFFQKVFGIPAENKTAPIEIENF